MVRFVRMLAAASVALTLSAGYAAAQAPAGIVVAQAKQRAPAVRHTGTHVYLLRGFMDVFSTGMDDLGSKIARRGIRASVHNHGEFGVLAEGIIDRHNRGLRESVVIIGHSLGGNDAFRMAERLGELGIPVPLIIAYDPTASMSVPRNVSRVVNFYSSTNGWGAPIVPGPGFRGSLSNVDLSRRGEMGHTDIDKSPALHAQSIGFIQSIGGRSATATAPAETSKDGGAPSARTAGPDATASAPKPAGGTSPAAEAGAPAKTETAASSPEAAKTSN